MDLRDDMLKRVKYRVLFVKRDYEASFYENEDVIDDNFDGSALVAWKTAEFIENLEEYGEKIPPDWGAPYPDGFRDQPSKGRFNGFPPEDRKYLRLSYEVLERYPRERFKYEEQQIRILEQIKDTIES